MFYRTIFFPILLAFSLLGAQERSLDLEDVHRVMDQIFEQHVSQKQMSAPLIKLSFKNYIDQFDRDHIYLLESEAAVYEKLSDKELAQVLNEYKSQKYTRFDSLNKVIQKAILRARSIRSNLAKNPNDLLKAPWKPSPNLKKPQFARSSSELSAKIKQNMADYINEQRKSSDKVPISNFIKQYEDKQRDMEDNYLYLTLNGDAFPQKKIENLFALHLLQAFAASLDSHTRVLDPQQAYEMRVRLEKGFHGIGVVLQTRHDGIIISHLVDGGPAQKSGKVLVDDKIVAVNGKSVEDESVDQLLDELKGDHESEVSLTLVREGVGKVEVNLTPELVTLNDDRVKYNFEPYGNGIIGKITLDSFYQGENGVTSEKDVKDAISQLKRKGNLKGLILDLRENSGGFLNQAVKVAGLFITNGVVVISKYSNGEIKVYRDMDGKVFYSGPMIVLTSRATASAAEIVAQSLQDWGVALVVGDEQTYGKGTIQSQTVTDEWSSSNFKVTVGKYYTVSGKTPQQNGVKADIVVPSRYKFEQIGEEYLELAMGNDKIQSAYSDQLDDIDPSLKQWYMRYYMPTMQRQQNQWIQYAEPIRNASRQRLSKNPVYQTFLKTQFAEDSLDLAQMQEGVNIVKDMIDIQAQRYNPTLVERTKD